MREAEKEIIKEAGLEGGNGGKIEKKKPSRYNSMQKAKSQAPEGMIGSVVAKASQMLRFDRAGSDAEVAQRLEWYFNEYATADTFPTVEGMALALGVHRDTLNAWEHGEGCSQTRSDMIKRAKGIIAECDAQLAAHGVIPQVVYIFRAKNYHGMRDQVETIATIQPVVPTVDAQSVVERYRDDMQL